LNQVTTVGNYRLLRPLGEGGMGIVYEAQHQTMGRRAAVKFLRRELAKDSGTIRRFFNEARASNEVQHPGIVQIYDCGTTDDGTPWLIMELLEGETLLARMGRLGRLSVADTVEWGTQVASALGAAHAAGIIHRDLKPENLFVVSDPGLPGGERVKVLDFGIAKLGAAMNAGGSQTKTGLVMGTPVYMSPEQCRGTKEIDSRSDIYSLGVILYQSLAGAPPFASEGLGELFHLHMNVQPPPLSSKNPDVSDALATTIHRALKKEPNARFQTMSELQADLSHSIRPGASGSKVALANTRPATSTDEAAASSRLPRVASTMVLPAPQTTLSGSVAEVREDSGRRGGGKTPLVVGVAALVAAGAVAAVTLIPRNATVQNPIVIPAEPRPPVAPVPVAPANVAGTAKQRDPEPIAPELDPKNSAPALIVYDIKTVPPDAIVVDSTTKERLGRTPLHREMPGDVERTLRIEKSGFVSRTVVVPIGRELKESFRLERVRPVQPQSPAEPAEEKILKL